MQTAMLTNEGSFKPNIKIYIQLLTNLTSCFAVFCRNLKNHKFINSAGFAKTISKFLKKLKNVFSERSRFALLALFPNRLRLKF